MSGLWFLFVIYAFALVIDHYYVQPYRRKKARRAQKTYEAGAISFALHFGVPAVFVVLTARTFVVDVLHVPTLSMTPTLNKGDFIVVNRLAYGLKSPLTDTLIYKREPPQPGEIFVFQYPREPRTLYVKRLLGGPGDHIQIDSVAIRRNGEVIRGFYNDDPAEKPPIQSTDPGSSLPAKVSRPNIDVIVPQGHYFALGDNLDHSEDSRHWGYVAARHLVGRVLYPN